MVHSNMASKYAMFIGALVSIVLFTSGELFGQGRKKDHPAPGKTHNNIACQKAPDTHYNLYLPSNYGPQKKWPLMFIFSPGGNANFGLYQDTAEELGWILVGSIECKNGPNPPIVKHQKALVAEVIESFSVHPTRMYASGLSGGARMSFGIMYVNKDRFDGIIPLGGGECPGVGRRTKVPWATVYGFAGKECFNNKEMRQLQKTLEGKYVKRFIFEEFPGGHTAPPADKIARAMHWLEQQFYLKPKRLTRNDREEKIPSFLKSAQSTLAELGNTFEAYEMSEVLYMNFKKHRECNPMKEVYLQLKKQPEIKREVAARKKYLQITNIFQQKKKPDQKFIASYKKAMRDIAMKYEGTTYGQKASEEGEN